MQTSVENSASVGRGIEPEKNQVWYGSGNAMDQSPRAHQERILRVINDSIIPKLSPEHQETAEKIRPIIEAGAFVAGVAITTSEIMIATAASIHAARWVGHRFGIGNRQIRRERLRSTGMPRRDHQVGSRRQPPRHMEVVYDDSAHMQMLMDIQQEIDEAHTQGKRSVWESAFADQFRALNAKGDETHDKKMRALAKKIDKRLKRLDIDPPVEPEEKGAVKANRLSDDVMAQIQTLTGNIRMRRENQRYEEKQRAESVRKEKERARLISLAGTVGRGIAWKNPELVGSLELARQHKKNGKKPALIPLAQLLDRVDAKSANAKQVEHWLGRIALAKRFGDRSAEHTATMWLLEELNGAMPVMNPEDVRRVSTYWVEGLDGAGMNVLLPKGPDSISTRNYLQTLFSIKDPQFLFELLTRRISRVSKHDALTPDLISAVRSSLDKGRFDPQLTRPVYDLLEQGYRLLLETRPDKEIELWDKIRALYARGPVSRHTLTEKEQSNLRKLNSWLLGNEPKALLAPLLSKKQFSPEAHEAKIKNRFHHIMKDLRDKIASRAQYDLQARENARSYDDPTEEAYGSTLLTLMQKLISLRDKPEAQRLVHAVRENGVRVVGENTDIRVTSEAKALIGYAYRQSFGLTGKSLTKEDAETVDALSNQFAKYNGPGVEYLYQIFPYDANLNAEKS